jgi:hypothetical protein
MRAGVASAATALVLAGLTLTGIGSAAQAAGKPTANAVAAVQRSWSYVPQYSSAPALESGRVVDTGGHAVQGATVVVFPMVLRPHS